MLRWWVLGVTVAWALGGCTRCADMSGCGSLTRASCPEGMVFIPGGTFMMGATPEEAAIEYESPAHQVTLSPYCMDRTEVTVAAYAQCTMPGCEIDTAGPNCAKVDKHPDHPRNCVTWSQAEAYCAFRGARLPTEAEWEFAARGTDGRRYPWGNEPPDPSKARYGDELHFGYPGPAPVGSHPAGRSPFGLEDMSGNVYEWVADAFGPYPSEPQVDPHGPPFVETRVLRGGSFTIGPWGLGTTFRMSAWPQDRYPYYAGLRCAADPE
jgi:formylglycine-generating enzyme required for sulfatase activity